jgi:hypothetical protein
MNHLKTIKVIHKKTGKIVNATYAHNRLGNLRLWADGKFYSDKLFDKTFSR